MFWQSLSASDREVLSVLANRRHFVKGTPLFLEGDVSDSVLIVESGWLKVTTSSAWGDEVLIELRGPGEIVGELGLITGARRSAAAVALEPAAVLVLRADDFRRSLSQSASLSSCLLTVLAHRLRQSVDRQLESGTTSAFERVCRRLLELAEFARSSSDDVIEIQSPLTQQELAEWIGMSRDAVVLAFKRLRQLRWVETGRRRIRILDREALARTARWPAG